MGRSPIPQFDVFNLKPKRQYYFRVTAKSRQGVESEIMTKGRVDLSKATKMPEFKKELPAYVRGLKGEDLVLECEVRQFINLGKHFLLKFFTVRR